MQPPSASQITFFARRNRRSRHVARSRQNDWVWLVAFGIAAVIMIGAGFGLSGAIGRSSACSHPLAPLGDEAPLSAQAFQDEDAALTLVIDHAASGDRAGAESAFYGDVHNFTHNVDRPLGEKDARLGRDLCHSVLDLEDALTSEISSLDLSTRVQRIRQVLADAAVAFGYDRPA